MHSGVATDDALNLSMSEHAIPLYEAVKAFIVNEVDPITEEYYRLGEGRAEHWGYGEGQLELLEGVKAKAKANGLWNFFLPNAETGEGLSNLDYAYIANELGKSPLASESLNCSAPDTGNMEVLERVGTPEQKEQWLKPLLNGEIRSAYVMTEPDVASSDAKQLECFAEEDGDEWVINGEKTWNTGIHVASHDIIFARTAGKAGDGEGITAFLTPSDAPGFEVLEYLWTFNMPTDHAHIRLTDVRVPHSSIFGGEGRGLQVVQHFFNENRIRQAASSLGAAQFCIDRSVEYAKVRAPFGKPLATNQAIQFPLVELHTQCEMLRALIHKTAWGMDSYGPFSQSDKVSMCNYWANRLCCEAADRAMQVHGGLGYSRHTPFEHIYRHHRRYRITEGSEEIQMRRVAGYLFGFMSQRAPKGVKA
jgi:acyl-CoA dehydrogenase